MNTTALSSAAGSALALVDSRLRADPLADLAIGAMFGHSDAEPEPAAAFADHCRVIAIVNAELAKWQSNGAMVGWQAAPGVPVEIAAPLEAYVSSGMVLPPWADNARIERAEELFIDYGMLSCTLLFCASLPECYVLPDLASVLHVAGQLEMHTDHRIRATAAMVFPVMMQGGLTRPTGGGVAQVLKVRLIHATIRHLILRGEPALADPAALVAPLPGAPRDANTGMHRALFEHGWDVARDGLPCNQEELAYTLLTFGYVFLRSLRKLGLGLSASDEESYLHVWNVMGHVLGIEHALMAHTMADAETLFAALQASGRARVCTPDVRPALGTALMQTMQNVIPLRLVKPFPVLMTRYLCGKTTATNIGIDKRVNLVSRLLFGATMLTVRVFDTVMRMVLPEFSIARLITRVVGYQFTVRVLMDQTRPLKLPPALLNQVAAMTDDWKVDAKAPNWMNNLEHRLTGRAPLTPAESAP
jgi:hypothetical protein